MTARELVECPVVVGTAGHVDHGKSALIEALTGKNPDRLEVERRRGMTTELGFGELELPGGKIVGLVDVPGHAHYLRAMVQGATGVDVALLVVSAVEGVMPQTREHVRALELLGVTRMVVALTMRDLADDEIATLAELDVEAFLDGTVFAGASIVPVSSKTGEGLDELLTVLDNAVCSCWSEHLEAVVGSGAAPRLPIDRCFSIRGTGTVVTGTLHDGPVSVGDELVALPSQTCCRVRGGAGSRGYPVRGSRPARRPEPGGRWCGGPQARRDARRRGSRGPDAALFDATDICGARWRAIRRSCFGYAHARHGGHGRGARPHYAFGRRAAYCGRRDACGAGAPGTAAAFARRRSGRHSVVFADFAA